MQKKIYFGVLTLTILSLLLLSGCGEIDSIKCKQTGGYWHMCEYGPAGGSGCYCDCERNGKIMHNNECKTKEEMINLGCSFPFPDNPLKPKCSEDTICCKASGIGISWIDGKDVETVNVQYIVYSKRICLREEGRDITTSSREIVADSFC